MGEMQTLKIDFPDIAEAAPKAQPEATPQLPANPMTLMKTLLAASSDIPDAAPAPPSRLSVDFFDLLQAVPKARPEQTPQLPANPMT
ncbi:MAG: hypothetical protein ABSG91_24955, partial [Syntrophobacteraceae bacterium]